jgi:hypothetical protein
MKPKTPIVSWENYTTIPSLAETLRRYEPERKPSKFFRTFTLTFCTLLVGVMLGYAWRMHHEPIEFRSHIEQPVDISYDCTDIPRKYLGQTSYTTLAGEEK